MTSTWKEQRTFGPMHIAGLICLAPQALTTAPTTSRITPHQQSTSQPASATMSSTHCKACKSIRCSPAPPKITCSCPVTTLHGTVTTVHSTIEPIKAVTVELRDPTTNNVTDTVTTLQPAHAPAELPSTTIVRCWVTFPSTPKSVRSRQRPVFKHMIIFALSGLIVGIIIGCWGSMACSQSFAQK
ncbi:hypothetical protein QC762_512890 [Podospora pseudocomata]|uniref:Uncharacterized protein n=1 Tax=Podospora pseudocomata TaxID=2093779 RepID=A0ABR0GAR8_9PEZI|nr:hypothetical protein QC762_512890 [Podospora pseudocomata]